MTLRVVVLGSAAGGGVPQWNCLCEVCRLAWEGNEGVRKRTQASLAVSINGQTWHLINASPDLRSQLLADRRLWPQDEGRISSVAGVVLMGTDIDQVGGLLTLREAQSLQLYATPDSFAVLDENSLFRPLSPAAVRRHALHPELQMTLLDHTGEPTGVVVTPFCVPGKTGRAAGMTNVGLLIGEAGRKPKCAYVPACAMVDDALIERVQGIPLLLFDGTFWSEDEMSCVGQAHRTASSMGHVAMSGRAGSLERLRAVDVGRKIYIHINNTNPVLIEGSDERHMVEQTGWSVACDGEEHAL